VIIAGNVIFRLVSLFVIIYLARYLGTEGFGKYSFVFAYLAFFNIITDLGLQQILVREMARGPSNTPALIGNAYVIRLLLTAFAVVLAIIIITLLPYPADTTLYIYIASFTLLFISFSDFYATIFQANLAMEYNVIAKLAFKFVSAGLILWIIFSHGTLAQVMVVLVFSEGIKTLISYLFSRKFVRPRFTIDFGLWGYLLKECLPLALTGVITIIYYRIDVVMLSMMRGDGAVGIYSAAYRLCEPFSLIPFALMMSLFPLMSMYFKESDERLVKACGLAIKYILIMMLPIVVGVTSIADRVILLVYGAEFASSTIALQILIWAILFGSMNSILLNTLVAIDRQSLNAWTIGLGAAMNVTLNFILIPIMGFTGAAITTVVTNVLMCVVCFYFVSKYLQMASVWKVAAGPIAGCVVMRMVLFFCGNTNLFLLVSFAAVVYFVVLLGLNVFGEDDWNIINNIIHKK
jgi:O-antigen/teichoic acid export membrane protein